MDYESFLYRKTQHTSDSGFDPVWMPDMLFDFQKYLVEWAVRRGRSAILSDCGTGKSAMQLVWAENVARKTNGRVLILAPLAVGPQTVREGEKFGVEVVNRREDIEANDRIVVTNYERLHYFHAADFGGVVCDESSILKGLGGATRKQVTRFLSKIQYRLLCTATAAPNDYVELGTHSEALGELSHSEMLTRFFRQLDDKGQKRERSLQQEADAIIDANPNYFKKLAYRVSQTIGQWRLKHHAVDEFWRWVASWARACRMPSDLGFNDGRFRLPDLNERDHVIKPAEPPPGMLFNIPACGLFEEREERKRTLQDRCEFAAELVNHDRPAVVWCHANPEGDVLEEIIPDGKQIAGKTPEDTRLSLYEDFVNGNQRVLILKPKIGAWGLNWQHCNHVVQFATHSYEQAYQSIRRCYRFGQKRPVTVDTIATEGEVRVLENMRRKAERATLMFDALVKHMRNVLTIEQTNDYTNPVHVASWIGQTRKDS